MIEGSVGSKKFAFLSTPKGKSGEVNVRWSDGREEVVRYARDDQGIWLETARGVIGFDLRKVDSEDSGDEVTLYRRKFSEVITGLKFLKAEEGNETAASAKPKGGTKIKSQMPGKIVRVNVKPGDQVKKGQSVIVMEAMKMENEIKSPIDGKIKEIKVTEGQAVETGSELLKFE